jgi:hypothetical protein
MLPELPQLGSKFCVTPWADEILRPIDIDRTVFAGMIDLENAVPKGFGAALR